MELEFERPVVVIHHPSHASLPTPVPVKGSISCSSSIEVPKSAKKRGEFRTENTVKKFFSKLCSSFLMCIKVQPAPNENSEISGDAVYDCLDECLNAPHYFRDLLVRTSSINPGYILGIAQTSLFLLLCGCENRTLRIVNRGCFRVTPTVIKYVLGQIFLNTDAEDRIGRTIFSYIRSAETLQNLEVAFPQLALKQDRCGRTALRLYATGQEQPPQGIGNENVLTFDERLKIVTYLIARSGEDIQTQDVLGNTILFYCPFEFIIQILLKKEPGLIFLRNNKYQLPEEVNLTFREYFTQFRNAHQRLRSYNPNQLLEIAVGRAIYFQTAEALGKVEVLQSMKSTQVKHQRRIADALEVAHAAQEQAEKDFKEIEQLIHAGADLTRSLYDIPDKPLFWHMIDQSIRSPWALLLSFAIRRASKEQISEALKYTILTILDGVPEEHLFRAARQLAAACEDPKKLKIKGKALEDWDREKGWKLFLPQEVHSGKPENRKVSRVSRANEVVIHR